MIDKVSPVYRSKEDAIKNLPRCEECGGLTEFEEHPVFGAFATCPKCGVGVGIDYEEQ